MDQNQLRHLYALIILKIRFLNTLTNREMFLDIFCSVTNFLSDCFVLFCLADVANVHQK